MLRTARLTDAMRGHGKTLAVSLGAAAALAGAGSASAVLTPASPAVHHLAALRTAPASAHAPAQLSAMPFTGTQTVAAPARATAATKVKAGPPAAFAPAQAQHAAPAPRPAPAHGQRAAAPQSAPAPAQPAAPQPAPAPAQPAAPAPAPQPTQPYQIYDSTTPSAIPAGQQAAVYANGAYAASPSQVGGHSKVLWIDTNGSDPQANVLDVEPGDATPQQAATWVWQKLHTNPGQTAIVYTMRSDWQATQAAIATLPAPVQSHVKWWIADPTGVPHIVPGADATQWSWGSNVDVTTATPGF